MQRSRVADGIFSKSFFDLPAKQVEAIKKASFVNKIPEGVIPDIGKDVVRGLEFKGRELKLGEKLPKNSVIDLILGDWKGK